MREKIFVITVFSVLFAVFFLSIIMPSVEAIEIENRIASKYEPFNLTAYKNGEYQAEQESALKDQMFGSTKLREFYLKSSNNINYNLASIYSNISNDSYILVGKSFSYDKENDFLNRTIIPENNYPCDYFHGTGQVLPTYNTLSESNIASSSVVTFLFDRRRKLDPSTNEFIDEIVSKDDIFACSPEYVNEYGDNIIQIAKQDTYDDVLKNMLSTDNHWNSSGRDLGYREMIDSLNILGIIDESPLEINGYVVDSSPIKGSLSTRSGLNFISTDLKANYILPDGSSLYDLPVQSITYDLDNNKVDKQLTFDTITRGDNISKPSTYVSSFEDKPRVLIMADSFSYTGTILPQMLYHFKSVTLVITSALLPDDSFDIRAYEEEYGFEFDLILANSITPIE